LDGTIPRGYGSKGYTSESYEEAKYYHDIMKNYQDHTVQGLGDQREQKSRHIYVNHNILFDYKQNEELKKDLFSRFKKENK